jgi:hypothetical protein
MNSSENIKGYATPFQTCNICKIEWSSRDNFLSDPNIELVGYQVHFEALTTGLLYFNHSCKGTLAFYADDFMDLYDGPVFTERATHGDDCPGHCLHKDNLEPCLAKCECASVREVLQIVKDWEKK